MVCPFFGVECLQTFRLCSRRWLSFVLFDEKCVLLLPKCTVYIGKAFAWFDAAYNIIAKELGIYMYELLCRILGMARAVWHDKNGQFRSFPNHHDITAGHPRCRETRDAGREFAEHAWQREGGRSLVLRAEATCLRVTVELHHERTVCILLPRNHLLLFPEVYVKRIFTHTIATHTPMDTHIYFECTYAHFCLHTYTTQCIHGSHVHKADRFRSLSFDFLSQIRRVAISGSWVSSACTTQPAFSEI